MVPQQFYQSLKDSTFIPHSSIRVWNEHPGDYLIGATRDHWMLLATLQGELTIKLMNEACEVKPGDMLLLSPSRTGYRQIIHSRTKTLRIPMLWIPHIGVVDMPLELLPPLTPIPHPNIKRLKECFAALDPTQQQTTAYKLTGAAILMELLTTCIVEGFKLGRYTIDSRPKERWVDEVRKTIQQKYKDPDLNLNALARIADRSPRRVQQVFKARFGESPINYLHRTRIHIAVRLLEANPDHKIEHLMRRVGYHSQNFFNKMFKRFTQTTPSSYRKK